MTASGTAPAEGIPTSRLLWFRILTAWAENATISPASCVSFHGSDWMVSRSICRMGFPSRCGIVVLLGRDPRGNSWQASFASRLFFVFLKPNGRRNSTETCWLDEADHWAREPKLVISHHEKQNYYSHWMYPSLHVMMRISTRQLSRP